MEVRCSEEPPHPRGPGQPAPLAQQSAPDVLWLPVSLTSGLEGTKVGSAGSSQKLLLARQDVLHPGERRRAGPVFTHSYKRGLVCEKSPERLV